MKNCNENSISPSTEKILAGDSYRSRKFRTCTILTEKFGKRVVRKFAATKEANAFVKDIVRREEVNAKYLKGHFDVLCGRLKGNCIEYEYMPHETLSRKIAYEFKENRYDKVDGLLGLYVEKLYALSRFHVCPKEFLSMVGQSTDDSCKFEADCLLRGLLDLTPRNIIINGSRWIVIDNEWSFDFPIPVIFVLFRAIVEMVIELQYDIRKSTTKKRPAVGILARGLRTYYFPEQWVKYATQSHISFAQMLRWELGFRQYITGSSAWTVGRTKIKPKIKTHFRAWDPDSGIVASLSNFLKKLPGMRQLFHSFERMLINLKK